MVSPQHPDIKSCHFLFLKGHLNPSTFLILTVTALIQATRSLVQISKQNLPNGLFQHLPAPGFSPPNSQTELQKYDCHASVQSPQVPYFAG